VHVLVLAYVNQIEPARCHANYLNMLWHGPCVLDRNEVAIEKYIYIKNGYLACMKAHIVFCSDLNM
jgi:hypothetical protein